MPKPKTKRTPKLDHAGATAALEQMVAEGYLKRIGPPPARPAKKRQLLHDALGITPAHARDARRKYGDGDVGLFDSALFIRTLDARRLRKGLSWRKAAAEIGVSASSISRLHDGYALDLESFARCIRWMETSADVFFFDGSRPSVKLTPAQVVWLAAIAAKGYDRGFWFPPNKSLLVLEDLGFVERNPTSSGPTTHWRITEAGQARHAGEVARGDEPSSARAKKSRRR